MLNALFKVAEVLLVDVPKAVDHATTAVITPVVDVVKDVVDEFAPPWGLL